MLFSATLDAAVDVLARRFMNCPAQHSVGAAQAPSAMVHHLLTVTPADRAGVVAVLAGGSSRSLVFTRTKRAAQKLARQLTLLGIPAGELHGDLPQRARERNLASFAAGAVRVMVVTDIAARGIHVDGIDLVIHADSPADHKAYLHRSGRTARAGSAGTVITLQTPVQAGAVRTLMRKAGVVPLTATVTPDSALLRSIAGEPRCAGHPCLTACSPRGGRHGHSRDRPWRGSAVSRLPWSSRSLTRRAQAGLHHGGLRWDGPVPAGRERRLPTLRPARAGTRGGAAWGGAAWGRGGLVVRRWWRSGRRAGCRR